MIGGEIYNLKLKHTYKISRLTTKNKDNANTNILVKCIDDNINNQIGLSYSDNHNIYVDTTPNQTARTYATLCITPKIDKKKQKQLIIKFNNYLTIQRKNIIHYFYVIIEKVKILLEKEFHLI